MLDDKSIDALIGYVNFSDGTASRAFRRAVNDFYAAEPASEPRPWYRLASVLRERIEAIQGREPAFRSTDQARAVVELVFDRVLPAYREHHTDLLFHLTDVELFRPFFLTRTFEATLAQHGPWSESDRIVAGALDTLNDFLGYRPLAVLNTGQKLQPYPHERVGAIAVYYRDVGVSAGRYAELIDGTLAILLATDPAILADAYFELDRLDELALDPRAYDHTHPVSQRPGYQFGEWDPHQIDNQGCYRRFILRPSILDALVAWLDRPGSKPRDAQAVLGGTILLASGVSGRGPQTHGSQTSLAELLGRLARCRDRFYAHHAGRSKPGAEGQPFAAVRQFLNEFLVRQRGAQVQHQYLARLFASMGYPEESRRLGHLIPAVSIRLNTEIQNLLTVANTQAKRGELKRAAQALPRVEDLLHRAIECGAMVDPWNVLGFGGNFTLFAGPEASITDSRVDLLLETVEQIFELFGNVLHAAAMQQVRRTRERTEQRLRGFADWWDRHATYEVGSVRRVNGQELAGSARFVVRVMELWRGSGSAAGDIAFWRRHAKQFSTAQSYALVVDALLRENDLLAAMALLMHWLSESDQIPTERDRFSFHTLALRWLAKATGQIGERGAEQADAQRQELAIKFFDYLEANAESRWHVPQLDRRLYTAADAEDVYAAAYEEVTYRDSTDDGTEGAVAEGPGGQPDGERLSELADELERRLRFLSTVARLWQLASSAPWQDPAWHAALNDWARQAQKNGAALDRLLGALDAHVVPPPVADPDPFSEYERQQATREDLLGRCVATSVEMAQAARGLGRAGAALESAVLSEWERHCVVLERAVWVGDAQTVRHRLPELIRVWRTIPLLYVPLEEGGDPRLVRDARYVREALRKLAGQLPRLGLLRETYHLLRAALAMESSQSEAPHQVSEFNLLFHVGYKGVIEKLVDSLDQWESTRDSDEQANRLIGAFVHRFSRLWMQHISGVRLSELERRRNDKAWRATVRFIERYGSDLFTQKFMAIANLRGILHQGTDSLLDYLMEREAPEGPCRLARELGRSISRESAAEQLEFILRAVLEHYDAYKDYNTTTTQSDYGENLHLLLDQLRLQGEYDRHRWALQPAYIAHGTLARRGKRRAAILLQKAFSEETGPIADQFQARLRELEHKAGLRIPAISDHLAERFVTPLYLDRVLALVEPSILEAETTSVGDSFTQLQKELDEYRRTAPSGSGDTPGWIHQIELEVHRVHERQFLDDEIFERSVGAPARPLSFEDLKRQLEQWDTPLDVP